MRHLVTRGHFKSRDKDNAVVENPMLLANLMALSFKETVVVDDRSLYIAGIWILDVFGPCEAVTLTLTR